MLEQLATPRHQADRGSTSRKFNCESMSYS